MIHVLYVDDEEILLDLAKLFLERTGKFVVDTASSAIGLVDSPTTGTYDAIISDYMMPGMNGIDFLKAIRAKYPDMPFILFTGRGREEVVIEAINNGVDFYLQKGGDPKAQFVELGHKVQQAVKRRRAERELYESEQRFSKAFHANPAISGLSELKTGTYIDVNDAFLKRLSFTREEVIGKSSIELNIINPQTRKELLHILEHEGYIHNHQISLRAKTGDVLHVLVSGDIIRSGGTDLLLVQAVDITERIKSQQALFESESRLRSCVEHPAEGIILIDEDGRIIEWNSAAEQILGISKQDALGMLCWELMAQMMPEEKRTINHSEGMKQRIITALKTGVPPSRDPIVIQIIGKDKTVRSIKQTTFQFQRVTDFGLVYNRRYHLTKKHRRAIPFYRR
jgi:PAS domain S-box-containing protein